MSEDFNIALRIARVVWNIPFINVSWAVNILVNNNFVWGEVVLGEVHSSALTVVWSRVLNLKRVAALSCSKILRAAELLEFRLDEVFQLF
jgi:hypothetical protein